MQVLILAIMALALGLISALELALLVIVLILTIRDKELRSAFKDVILILVVTLPIFATAFYFLAEHLFSLL